MERYVKSLTQGSHMEQQNFASLFLTNNPFISAAIVITMLLAFATYGRNRYATPVVQDPHGMEMLGEYANPIESVDGFLLDMSRVSEGVVLNRTAIDVRVDWVTRTVYWVRVGAAPKSPVEDYNDLTIVMSINSNDEVTLKAMPQGPWYKQTKVKHSGVYVPKIYGDYVKSFANPKMEALVLGPDGKDIHEDASTLSDSITFKNIKNDDPVRVSRFLYYITTSKTKQEIVLPPGKYEVK